MTQVIGHRGASPRGTGEHRSPPSAPRAGAGRRLGRARRAPHGRRRRSPCTTTPTCPTGGRSWPLTRGRPARDVPDARRRARRLRRPRAVNVEIKNWPDDVDFDPALAVVDAVVDVLVGRPATERAGVLVSSLPPADGRPGARARARPRDGLARDRAGRRSPALRSTLGRDALATDGRRPTAHRALHPHHAFVTAELVDAAHAAGLAVNTWTVDDPDRMPLAGRPRASTASSPTSPTSPSSPCGARPSTTGARPRLRRRPESGHGSTRSRTSGSWRNSSTSASPR